MTDLALIVALMKQNTDALGFIPAPAISARWIRKNRYLIQRDSRNRRCGYLLHGPVHPNGDLYVNQVCLELDQRRRLFGTQLVNELLNRARIAGASRIRLRCANDLPAATFCISVGGNPSPLLAGGFRRSQVIRPFTIDISPPSVRQDRS